MMKNSGFHIRDLLIRIDLKTYFQRSSITLLTCAIDGTNVSTAKLGDDLSCSYRSVRNLCEGRYPKTQI